MVTYANGMIPASAMTRLSVGGALLPAAAGNFEVWRALAANAGYTLTITSAADAFRTYEVQERIFRERYTTTYLAGRPTKRWLGQTWWLRPKQATAAVPGTSNHGRGLAVDIRNAGAFTGAFYRWMAATGPALGWSNTEGRSINEPWHWVNDNVPRGGLIGTISDAIPEPTTPTTLTRKGFLMALDDDQQKQMFNLVVNMAAWIYGGGAGVNAGQFASGTLAQRVTNLDRQLTGAQGNATNAVDAIGVLLARTADVTRDVAVPLRQEIADTKTMVTALVSRSGADVDETALAAALAPLLSAATPTLSDDDLKRVATSVADEQARRLTNGA